MKYIEELIPGDCFLFNNNYWLLTIDFKKDHKKLCYNLQSGCPSWLNDNDIVEAIQIYTMDESNTILAIKETKNATAQTHL